ncbi:hypothetical protein [Paenibacillus assamensis]|uniref:hypothetical protein n=1 Tax=Paenibacillus assamensis TaxID=311244 RepID=UPI00040377F8|nr:hypothetical protein [Paenibacillus assamensis]
MSGLTAELLLITTAQDLSRNIKKHVEECSEKISSMINHLNLLDFWSESLVDTPTQVILKEIGYDLLSSIYISTNGMYRNAYISLRSAIELGIGFFYFTDHNYDFLEWKRNNFDLTWSRLKDFDKGVLSKKYLSLFNDKFNFELYIELVSNIYRECSEYVHGKYDYMHSTDSHRILFSKEKFNEWSNMFLQIVEVIIVLLSVRFNEKLGDLDGFQLETSNDIFRKLGFMELIIENEY